MKKGDLVKWKKLEHRTANFKNDIGVIVEISWLDHKGAQRFGNGALVHWPGKGIYWSPLAQLEVISEAG